MRLHAVVVSTAMFTNRRRDRIKALYWGVP
jgi:hypothetical protein